MPRPRQRALPRAASPRGRRLAQCRRHHGTGVPRGVAVRLGVLRGSAGARDAARLGRRGTSPRGSGRTRTSPRKRRWRAAMVPGHRPMPNRAHVPRGPAPRDRARGDPRGAPREPRRGRPRGGSAARCTEGAARRALREALAQLERLQQRDFEGSFRRWTACPSWSGSSIRRCTNSCRTSSSSSRRSPQPRPTSARPAEDDARLLAAIRALHEPNPMLGLRGCRLGLMVPELVQMQTRAILNARSPCNAQAGGL